MLRCLSAFSSGVPVKPTNIASGRSSFIAACSFPDCVRWHSSTKTKNLPFGAKSSGRIFLSSSMNFSIESPAPDGLPNLWISEQISDSVSVLSCETRSAPLLVR